MGRLTKLFITRILDQHKADVRTYIETGTLEGKQLEAAADLFDTSYGIELDKHYARETERRVEDLIGVHVLNADSAEMLPKILKEFYDEPLFIVLDAHYCEVSPPIEKYNFPLWEELEAINNRGLPDIVCIDDVHTFGKDRPELRISPEAPEWRQVTKESLTAFFGDRVEYTEEAYDHFIILLKDEND